MSRTEPIIAVQNVIKSSQWYQSLLACKSSHGGSTFEILRNEEEEVILCLHEWEAHGHPTISDSSIAVGNGLILYIRVEDLEHTWKQANSLKANIHEAPHFNENSGKNQFTLRDLDGYYLMISE